MEYVLIHISGCQTQKKSVGVSRTNILHPNQFRIARINTWPSDYYLNMQTCFDIWEVSQEYLGFHHVQVSAKIIRKNMLQWGGHSTEYMTIPRWNPEDLPATTSWDVNDIIKPSFCVLKSRSVQWIQVWSLEAITIFLTFESTSQKSNQFGHDIDCFPIEIIIYGGLGCHANDWNLIIFSDISPFLVVSNPFLRVESLRCCWEITFGFKPFNSTVVAWISPLFLGNIRCIWMPLI